MTVFNNFVYLIGSITTLVSIVICLALFFICKSKNSNAEKIVLDNKSPTPPLVARYLDCQCVCCRTGVALMYAPCDLVGYVKAELNPVESITMVALLGAPVWALYSVMALWYMKHMDSKIGKLAAMLSAMN